MSVSACPLFAHRGDNAVTVGGGFHLHPLRPDGSGESEGCITFVRRTDFYTVRQALLRRKTIRVPGSRNSFMAHRYVDVQGESNVANCKIR